MDEEDMDERCCDNEREGLEINTLENVMGNVNMIIEDIDKSEIDKIFKQKGIEMEREWYIVEVEGEGCYCLCYDDEAGERVVVDWDLEIRED